MAIITLSTNKSRFFLGDTAIVTATDPALTTLVVDKPAGLTITRFVGPVVGSGSAFLIKGLKIGQYLVTAPSKTTPLAPSKTILFAPNSNSLTISVVDPSINGEWSKDSGYKWPADRSERKKIIDKANALIGQKSGQSVIAPNATYKYLTDIDDHDGEKTRDAYKVSIAWRKYSTWKQSNQKATVQQKSKFIDSINGVDAKTAKYVSDEFDKDSSAKRLIQLLNIEFKSSKYEEATKTLLSKKIIADNADAPPTTDQEVLNRLGIQKQCAEWMQTIGGNKGDSLDKNKAAPGMGLVGTRPHSMIIIDVKYDDEGKPIDYKIVDSNWGAVWSNPPGDVAWERMIRGSSILERSIAGRLTLRKFDKDDILFGTPKPLVHK